VTLSTHVLDTGRGEPAPGVPVRLERASGGEWIAVAAAHTDHDGRVRDWVPAHEWVAGRYRLVFDTAAHLGPDAFFPEVTVVFEVVDPVPHLHVPLLLSRYGYTTYRGS
jgi:hydroxyisourate hydrolase